MKGMTDNTMNRSALAAVLAEKLPDGMLEEVFPDFSVAEVRSVLIGKKKTVVSQPEIQQRELFAQPVADAAVVCKLFTDGASRGNPGKAGAGSVLLAADGRELAARSLYLGQCTNNVAEYKALILGLQSALELECGRLEIFLDSQLIVRQIQGRYKVKHPTLKPLFEEVKELLAKIDSWSIAHVPREQNKRADELANKGIDERVK